MMAACLMHVFLYRRRRWSGMLAVCHIVALRLVRRPVRLRMIPSKVYKTSVEASKISFIEGGDAGALELHLDYLLIDAIRSRRHVATEPCVGMKRTQGEMAA